MDAATAALHLSTCTEAIAVLGHLLAVVHAVSGEEMRTIRDPCLRQPFPLHACPLGVVHGGAEARRGHIPSFNCLKVLEEVAAATSGWSPSGRIAIASIGIVADAVRPVLEDVPGPGALEAGRWGEMHDICAALEGLLDAAIERRSAAAVRPRRGVGIK